MDQDVRKALACAHYDNIARYVRLLATELTEAERESIRNRIMEEQQHLDKLLTVAATD
jgi:hypothetical protein